MKSPLHSLSLPSILSSLIPLMMAGGFACSGEPSDEETTAAEAGDGDGDGDMSGGESGSASGSGGDGDGDGEGEETDPDCPAGTFDCPCDDGMCVEGLTCGGDGLCSLGGDPTTTTGDPTDTGDPTTETTTTTTGGTAEPYDPASCEAPSEILHVELLEGEFCAAPCISDDECPEGPPGTTQACSISTDGQAPNFCGLICDPTDSACPMGSSCKEIPQQAGFGLCTYP